MPPPILGGDTMSEESLQEKLEKQIVRLRKRINRNRSEYIGGVLWSDSDVLSLLEWLLKGE